jgi:queuine/archaeosine tRNA-ribosyltransferase
VLIDRVVGKLPKWKGKLMNRSGRLTLVNESGGTPVFNCSKKRYITSESNTFLLTIYFSRAFEKQYISVTVQVETCATISTVLDIKA